MYVFLKVVVYVCMDHIIYYTTLHNLTEKLQTFKEIDVLFYKIVSKKTRTCG